MEDNIVCISLVKAFLGSSLNCLSLKSKDNQQILLERSDSQAGIAV